MMRSWGTVLFFSRRDLSRGSHPTSLPDDSANTLLYAFYLLALHLEVQEELYREIQATCGDHCPGLSDIPNMIYALCIMYETMRLYPVLGTLPTMPANDEMLLGKYLIPKGTSIGPDLVNLHRNEKYWGENSGEFDPSRFDNRHPDSENWHAIMDGKIKIPVKGAFFAFGDGPRACLGKNLFFHEFDDRQKICRGRIHNVYRNGSTKVDDPYKG